MEASLIVGLIEEAILSLIQKLFFDLVNLIVHTCDIKNKQIHHYLLLKKTVKLHQLSTSFQVNFEVCLSKFQK